MNGSLEEAAAHWREALSFRQDDAALHNDLGAMLALLGRIQEGVLEFEAVLSLDPKLKRPGATCRPHAHN